MPTSVSDAPLATVSIMQIVRNTPELAAAYLHHVHFRLSVDEARRQRNVGAACIVLMMGLATCAKDYEEEKARHVELLERQPGPSPRLPGS